MGARLYAGIGECLAGYLSQRAVRISAASDDSLLSVFDSEWREFKLTLMMIKDILLYMDRTYVQAAKVKPTYEMGMELFVAHVLHSPAVQVQTRLLYILLSQVARFRNGEITDVSLLQNVIEMYVTVGAQANFLTGPYVTDFESDFLKQTAEFYHNLSQDFLHNNDLASYLAMVKDRLTLEEEGVAHFLHSSTRPKLISIVENELITQHTDVMFDTTQAGLTYLVDNQKLAELHLLFKLTARVPSGSTKFNEALSLHIRSKGMKINEDWINARIESPGAKSVPCSWFEHVLDLYTKLNYIWKEALDSDLAVESRTNDAFASFINTNKKASTFVAAYFDENLGKKAKKTETELEVLISDAMSFFRFLQDKDYFSHSYTQYLARRLLNDRCISHDVEKLVISRFKIECGSQYTSWMEGMFNDIKMSSELSTEFKSSHDRLKKSNISPTILTSSFWPVRAPDTTYQIPAVFEDAVSSFTAFYSRRHTGRKLSWLFNMGSVELSSTYSNGAKHELVVPPYCSFVLLLFNDSDDVSYEEMKLATCLDDDELE
eukprot:Partr_v1_DN27760_c1_g1_i4_m67563 putative Cullin 3